jgi:hypothetical protein
MKERNLKQIDGKWSIDISFMKPDGKLKRVRAASSIFERRDER